VKQPAGPILIVEDSFDKRSHRFYQAALDTIAGGRYAGRYEFLNIRERASDGWYRRLPRLLTPMFVETLKLFDVVLWYGDIGLSLDIPQTVLPGYLEAGGKLLFSAPLPNLPTPEMSLVFIGYFPPLLLGPCIGCHQKQIMRVPPRSLSRVPLTSSFF